MSRRVTMLVRNTVHNDNRVLKEAAALAEAGYQVALVGMQGEGLADEESYAGARIVRVPADGTTRKRLRAGMERRQELLSPLHDVPLAYKAAGAANRTFFRVFNRLSWRVEPLTYLYDFDRGVAQRERDLQADLWWAHDLNTLPTALRLREAFGGKVVYDSHEYWLDCNNVYSPFAKRVWAVLERTCIGLADRVVTVSPSIADRLRDDYGVERPAVILNTPPFREVGRPAPLRERYLVTTKHVLVYVGLVTHQRGYEQVIDALRELPDVTVLCFGHGGEAYRGSLVERAAAAGVTERFKLVGSVPPDAIQEAIAAADAGLAPVQRGALSYDFALPSKLFEYVFAGLPVVAGDLVEIRKLVDEYRLGVCVDERDPAALAAGIRRVLRERDAYRGPAWDARRREFAAKYAWDNHKRELVALVEGLIGPARPEAVA